MKKQKFSQREGINPVRDKFQIKDMDNPLRIGLWNVFYASFIDKADITVITSSNMNYLFTSIWCGCLGHPMDSIRSQYNNVFVFGDLIKHYYFESSWAEVYDLIEFIIDLKIPQSYPGIKDPNSGMLFRINMFTKECNNVMEKEMAGYRIIDNTIVQITDENEINEIEELVEKTRQTKLSNIYEHINTALTLLSDRQNPDYRNSIKESISAVEAICRIIARNDNATLGEALNIIKNEEKVEIHPALKNGYSAIYGYTNDASGIRHPLKDKDPCDFSDAKYMLVSCSAFINYLIMKAQQAGIPIM